MEENSESCSLFLSVKGNEGTAVAQKDG